MQVSLLSCGMQKSDKTAALKELAAYFNLRIGFHSSHAWVPPAPSMKCKTQLAFSFLSRTCPQNRHPVTHLSCHSACGVEAFGETSWGLERLSAPPFFTAMSPWPVYMCYRLNVRGYHPKFICRNLIPNVVVLGGEAFGRRLGHEGGALVNETPAFIKETPESSFTPSSRWGLSEKRAVDGSGSGPSPNPRSADIAILDF